MVNKNNRVLETRLFDFFYPFAIKAFKFCHTFFVLPSLQELSNYCRRFLFALNIYVISELGQKHDLNKDTLSKISVTMSFTNIHLL